MFMWFYGILLLGKQNIEYEIGFNEKEKGFIIDEIGFCEDEKGFYQYEIGFS